MSGPSTGYRVDSDTVDSMELDGEAVVLDLSSHRYFGLNGTGTLTWELVKAHPGITAEDIATALGTRHGLAPAEIREDVAALLNTMAEAHLVGLCAPVNMPPVNIERRHETYTRPHLEAYGALDTLILSGE